MNINLIVLRVADLDRSRVLYETIGLKFSLERHGRGPEHLAAEIAGIVFELYPRGDLPPTSGARVGFSVTNAECLLTQWQQPGEEVLTAIENTAWGRRAVLADFDGHRIEISEVS